MSETILSVKNLNVQFITKRGIIKAVQDVSYSLEKGEAVGIVGESGCGKSVSVLSLLRLLPENLARIKSDEIRFCDTDLLHIANKDMQNIRGSKISIIFQDPMASLNPVLTIGRQLREPLIIHRMAKAKEANNKALELLRMVQIPDPEERMNNYPYEMSGGMRQRVMIAMSLICNPELLIADEPTTALDVTVQAQIIDLVKELRRRLGMSLIWISHDLGIIAGLVNRVLVMYAGTIVEEALVDDLFYTPRHPYTRALLASIPQAEGQLKRKLQPIRGSPPDLLNLPRGCLFAERCNYVKDVCRKEKPPIRRINDNHRCACWMDTTTSEVL